MGLVYLILVREGQRKEVYQGYDEDPDEVYEVPVHLGGLNREVVIFGEVAAQRAHETDGEEEQTDGDVCAVEAGERVEDGAENAGAWAKGVVHIFIELDADEGGAQNDREDQADGEATLIAASDGAPSVVHGDAAGEQDNRVDDGERDVKLSARWCTFGWPLSCADKQIEIDCDEVGEEYGLR